jgi:MFS family permease
MAKKDNKKTKKPSLFILSLLISFGAVNAALLAPALPELAHYFQVEDRTIQLTVTLFLFGYAGGQLLYGPTANYFGRKKSLYIGLFIAIVGLVLCISAHFFSFFPLLLIGRFISAIGSCVGFTLSFTIISDYYHTKTARKLIAYLIMLFAAMPGIATLTGGNLSFYFGWLSCFYFLMGYSLVLLMLITRLPETAYKLDKTAGKLINILNNYLQILYDKKLLACALLIGSATACDYLVSTLMPFVAFNTLNLQTNTYGAFNMLSISGLILGCFTSSKLAIYYSEKKVILFGIILSSIATIFLFLLLETNGNAFHLWILFSNIAVLFTGISLVYCNAVALANAKTKDKANSNATMSFINLSIAAITILLISSIPEARLAIMIGLSLSIASMWIAFFYLVFSSQTVTSL